MGRAFGVRGRVPGPAEVLARYPLLDGRGVVGGLLPNDGQTNPIDTTMAYAKGARQRGVKIVENTEVDDASLVENGRAPSACDGAGPRPMRRATPW
jgi:4-methylaminobutanoate oxidase (formaldehyde-forming)